MAVRTEWKESAGEWVPKIASSGSSKTKSKAKGKRLGARKSLKSKGGGKSTNRGKNRVWLLAEREQRDCVTPMTYTRHFPDRPPADPFSLRPPSSPSDDHVVCDHVVHDHEYIDSIPCIPMTAEHRHGVQPQDARSSLKSTVPEFGSEGGTDTEALMPNYYSLYSKNSIEQIGMFEVDSNLTGHSMQREPPLPDLPESHSVQHSVKQSPSPKMTAFITMSDPSLNKVGTVMDEAEFSDTELPKALTGRNSISSYFTTNSAAKMDVETNGVATGNMISFGLDIVAEDQQPALPVDSKRTSKRRKRTWTGTVHGDRRNAVGTRSIKTDVV